MIGVFQKKNSGNFRRVAHAKTMKEALTLRKTLVENNEDEKFIINKISTWK